MDSQGFVFLFIQEENKINTSRRIFKFVEVLNELKMETKKPEDDENCLTLLNDMKYKPNLIIVNIGHPFLEQIIQTSQKVRQFVPIVLIYTSKTFNDLQKIEEKYGLKYDLEKSKINILEFRVLYEQIKSSSQFLTQTEENKRYSYILQIGSGTSATVHLVHDNEKNRKVAMKKIDSSEMKDTEKERVQKEVDNMKSMKIPTFIEFYDYESDNDTQKIYMEYADQGTLENKIAQMKKDGKDFTTDEIFDYLIDILLALFTLNKKGIVHRDIKSENILLKTENIKDKNVTIAKLSDLGLGRQIEGVSGAYTTCGTAYYVCPEIAAGEKKYSYNADIWSLGIVLYELITKNKPWFDPKMSTSEFFQFVVDNKYPPLPENTDSHLKYLVKIMLKKDPERRPNCEDILSLDFMYEKTIQLIDKCNWKENETFIKLLDDLKSKVKPCYLFLDILSEKDNLLLKDARKISESTEGKDYKVGYFSRGYKNTKNGEDLLETISELKAQGGEINDKEETPNKLLKELISSEILVCVSHTIKDVKDEEEVNQFIENFLDKPRDYIFKIPFGDFDSYNKVDNEYFCNFKPEKKIDYLTLSQYILKTGLNLFKDYLKEQTMDLDNMIFDKRYIEFKYGISLFNDCDIADIPYKDTKLKKVHDRLAFLLNLYQIMFLDYNFNTNLNKVKSKGGILSFLSYDIVINYKFKDMTLNHLEIKHVIFRNNKPVPGSYLRLVYQSDKKCTLLPNFENHKPLLFLLDFNQDIGLFIFKIFSEKDVDAQLNDIALKFILNNINLVEEEEELEIPPHIKLILTDFGANNTAELPEGFLQEILKILKTQRDLLANNKKYKLKLNEEKLKELDYLNQKLVREIADGIIKVNFVEKI